jgi:short subunit dehydrogenase-like uncharacterized protein
MEPILVFGATGYTGRLVVRSLESASHPFVIAGRGRAGLERLSRSLPSHPEVRVADALDRASLLAALGGMKAVIATVGPFARLGMPLATAAVDLGVHYVDTTGEQTFQIEVYEKLHRKAVSTGSTVITGAAFESSFGYLGAAVLHERCGPLVSMSTSYFLESFRPSAGTVRSALLMLAEELVSFRDGKLVPLPTAMSATEATFAGERQSYHSVAIPGGDSVLLPLDIASLQSATTHALLPRAQAQLLALLLRAQPALRRRLTESGIDRIAAFAGRLCGDPADARRAAVGWKVFVQGRSPTGTHLFVASGHDVYAISATVAAQTAIRLAAGRARDAGVMTTGKALPAVEFLDGLRPEGVRWELR